MTNDQKAQKLAFFLFCFDSAKTVLSEWPSDFDGCPSGVGSMSVRQLRKRVDFWIESYNKLLSELPESVVKKPEPEN